MKTSDVLPGTIVRTSTPLRPSGKVVVGDSVLDARAEGEWFDAGQPVSVLRADGFGLVVGRPGTVSLSPGPGTRPDRPSDQSHDPEESTPSDWPATAERYLVGLMAFVAMGVSLGGISLLVLAFIVPPRTLLHALPLFLCGGAAIGATLFHVGFTFGTIRRIARRVTSPGTRPEMLAGVLTSPIALVLACLIIGAAGIVGYATGVLPMVVALFGLGMAGAGILFVFVQVGDGGG